MNNNSRDSHFKFKGKIKKWWGQLGPGFITGASDDDPSGIATYAQTGARFGFGQLWLAFATLPFMVAVQEMSGRIGLVTGKGLAGIIRERYSRVVLFFTVGLLVIANTINIGADLGAMAASARLLFGLPFIWWLIFFVVGTLLLETLVPYKIYAKYLKWLTLSLLTYIFVGLIVNLDWLTVWKSILLPTIINSKEYFQNIVAVLGTTISPYLFFWQAEAEVEESKSHHRLRRMGEGVMKVLPQDISRLNFDTTIGMIFSNIIMFFIILTTAATLHVNGINDITSASQAAEVLRPIAGDFSYLLFALGIIGTGLLTVPILAGSASYAVSEALGWRAGLNSKFSQAHGFYGVIIISMVVGLLINFTSLGDWEMLYYAAVVNGLLAPPLLVMMILISRNKSIMGEYVVGKTTSAMVWIITVIMAIVALTFILL